jgi:hypothetical protein
MDVEVTDGITKFPATSGPVLLIVFTTLLRPSAVRASDTAPDVPSKPARKSCRLASQFFTSPCVAVLPVATDVAGSAVGMCC